VGDGVDGVGDAPSLVSSGLRRTNRTTSTTTLPPRIAHLTHGFTDRGYPSVRGRPAARSTAGSAQVGWADRRAEGTDRVDIIWDLVKFGIIFGVLATAPVVTWLAISWLVTDRRRSSTGSGSS
jgi:hypothetical protein